MRITRSLVQLLLLAALVMTWSAAVANQLSPTVPAPPTFSGALITCGTGGTHATLSAAVAAASPGDRIEILAGSTIVETSAVTVNKSLEIFGTGTTCIVQRNSTTAVINVTVGNVYLHDFHIVNNTSAVADGGGGSACVSADTMNRTSLGGATGLYFQNLECEQAKVGIFISGTNWVVRGCSFRPSSGNTTAGTTLRSVFVYGSEGQCFISNNTYLTTTDEARLTAIYLNTRNDGVSPNWEGGYKGDLVINGNVINDGGGAPRSYIDATSIFHQSGPAATAPPTGQLDLFLLNNDFSLDHRSSPVVFFGRSYSGTPVQPLSFFGDFVVANNSFGAREASTSQKGAIFFTSGSGAAMGQFVGGFFGAGNSIDSMTLPTGNSTVMADSSLLLVREDVAYTAPTALSLVAITDADADGDGLLDIQETARGTNSALKDSEGDTLEDGVEAAIGYGPLAAAALVDRTDTDGDLLPDNWETANGYNPANPDQDGDGFRDGYEVAAKGAPSLAGVPVIGDVNGTGVADNNDASIIFNYYLGNIAAPTYPARGDLDRNGTIDYVDAVILFNWSLMPKRVAVIPYPK